MSNNICPKLVCTILYQVTACSSSLASAVPDYSLCLFVARGTFEYYGIFYEYRIQHDSHVLLRSMGEDSLLLLSCEVRRQPLVVGAFSQLVGCASFG